MKPCDSILTIKGIGNKAAECFRRLNIQTVSELLYFLPRRFVDRSVITDICDLSDGSEASVKAVLAANINTAKLKGAMSITTCKVYDKTGLLSLVWFNNKYIPQMIKPDVEYIFCGAVKRNKIGKLEMQSPIIEPANTEGRQTGRIVPIYPLTAGLSTRLVQNAIYYALDNLDEPIAETIPQELLLKYSLMEINEAIRNIHKPNVFEDFHRARRRLVFEEFLYLQLGFHIIKGRRRQVRRRAFSTKAEIHNFTDSLPYPLTNAQNRVISEIYSDLIKDMPMNRLVQGDVGSGKTVVAAAAMFAAFASGFQASMMAPTEILAKQHYATLTKLFAPFAINVVFLSSGISTKEKALVLEQIKDGYAHIAVGTHALLSDNVVFRDLGLIVTDEQHRFGVRQRGTLASKAENAHTLIMSATPIPRTLGLVIYGDTDISIIDEMPPGRTPVKTYAVNDGYRMRVYNFIKKALDAGRQTYIVCSQIEENELDLKSATEYAANLTKEGFGKYNIGLMHSKLKPDEKTRIMNEFIEGRVHILVSTTVIEVGVDVPNANIMLIEDAHRFGLSQLHQLRGRVGRGAYESYCILFNNTDSKIANERIGTLCATNDGFKIAERDLELRGVGEFFGTKQHGLPELKIGDLYGDAEILKESRVAYEEILERLHEPSFSKIKENALGLFYRRGGEGLLN